MAAGNGEMNSLERMLSLLEVFTPAAPVWSMDDLIQYAGVSRSTCYRQVRALQGAGLLTRVGQSAYMLGPAVIELDRSIRVSDPIYLAGAAPMRSLCRATGQTVILCVLYSGAVMCVREEIGVDAPVGSFSRGQKRPLFTAAASKVILAQLPAHQLRRLYARHRTDIAKAGLGADWDGFRAALRKIRDAGHCVTVGEFTPGIVGIAAPIFNRSGQVLGSLGIAMASSPDRRRHQPRLVESVTAAAAKVTEGIAAHAHADVLPARAVG
ncbi:MAG: IclR family transcriptional regulator [Lautropia sp.]